MPVTPKEKPDRVPYICHPSDAETETGNSGGYMASLSCVLSELNERSCLKKQGVLSFE